MRALRGLKPDVKKEVRRLTREGFTLSRTGSGHIRLRAPSGAVNVFSATPQRTRRSVMRIRTWAARVTRS